MAQKEYIIAALNIQHPHGERLLGNRWHHFAAALRELLRTNGMEDLNSTSTLFLFGYQKLLTAVHSVYSSLERVKLRENWQSSWGPVPIQFAFALARKGDILPKITEITSCIWGYLQHEVPHISKPLKKEWQELAASSHLPGGDFIDEEEGILKVLPKSPMRFENLSLFQHRELPGQGKFRECFYCGMKRHPPGSCPTKILSPSTNAISQAGYLPFPKLNENFKTVFSNMEEGARLLDSDAGQGVLRSKAHLLVLVAYFDIFHIFQHRFFRRVAFSGSSKWASLMSDPLAMDNSTLSLAIDCLRVGQYENADSLFKKLGDRPHCRQFYSFLGLAFIALEQKRIEDFGHYLEMAHGQSTSEKEKVYATTLLARHFTLIGDTWKARGSIKALRDLAVAPEEAEYHQIVLDTQAGYSESLLKRLWVLAENHKETLFAIMIDPRLRTIHNFVDEMLATWHRETIRKTKNIMEEARLEFEKMERWLTPKNEKVAANRELIALLEKQFQRKALYDAFEIPTKARLVATSCSKVFEESVEEFSASRKKYQGEIEKILQFWNDYPYHYPFQGFMTSIALVQEQLKSAAKILKEAGEGNSISATSEDVGHIFNLVEKERQHLEKLRDKMTWLEDIVAKMKLYAKKLLIAEVALNVAGIVIFTSASAIMAETSAGNFAVLARDPWVRQQSYLVLSLIVAPFAALGMTLYRLGKKKS